jgi:hypothetical protein
MRYRVRLSARTPANQTEAFRGFPLLLENAGTASQLGWDLFIPHPYIYILILPFSAIYYYYYHQTTYQKEESLPVLVLAVKKLDEW